MEEVKQELFEKAIQLAKDNKDKITVDYLKLKLHIGMVTAYWIIEELKERKYI